MRLARALSLLAFACVWAVPVVAQNGEVSVPILKAPYHLPVFTNEHVTVFKVFIPPGRNTGYHTHTEDGVSVSIVPADMTNQNLGSSEATRLEPTRPGRVAYTTHSEDAPLTHKVTNIGQTPFHLVYFMFGSSQRGQFTPSSQTLPTTCRSWITTASAAGAWCLSQASRHRRSHKQHPELGSL